MIRSVEKIRDCMYVRFVYSINFENQYHTEGLWSALIIFTFCEQDPESRHLRHHRPHVPQLAWCPKISLP
jgi:hypothetical protein